MGLFAIGGCYVMKLSIVIVSYNVKYFLGQLLRSLFRSKTTFTYEVVVVDNNSADGSADYVAGHYPQVKLIRNASNDGFSRATNLGIEHSIGQYVLLLNPDTLLQDDTFELCICYMEAHPHCGALGCRMVDGSGVYLPESKRGYPTPFVALCRITGLSQLFPGSRLFNGYYQGHLNEWQVNEVEVLTGAFMCLRRSVLDEVGLLDEDYFMYAEDIDLSYRIGRAGYQVIYFPQTSIIHFKGESTQRASLDYVRRFYGSMQIFIRKHFGRGYSQVLRLLLVVAVWGRGLLALSTSFFRRWAPPLMDAVVTVGMLHLFAWLWAYWYFGDQSYYDGAPLVQLLAGTGFVYVCCLWLAGAYDKTFMWWRWLKGIGTGFVLVLLSYALVSGAYRTSRVVILASGPLALLSTWLWRVAMSKVSGGSPWATRASARRFAVVGSPDLVVEARRLVESVRQHAFVGYIAPDELPDSFSYIGSLPDIGAIVQAHGVEELVFCADSIPSGRILETMAAVGPDVYYKIFSQQTPGIVGSSSKFSAGEAYTYEIRYNLAEPVHRRNKRLLDIGMCLVFALLMPVLILKAKYRSGLVRHWLGVLTGRRSWVSYNSPVQGLFPPLRPGVLTPEIPMYREREDLARIDADYYYAKDYSIWTDLSIIANHVFS